MYKLNIPDLKERPDLWIFPFDKPGKPRSLWGIFVNGKRVQTRRGKYVWTMPNHAKAAFLNTVTMQGRKWNSMRFEEIAEALLPEYKVEIREVG